MLSVRSWRWVRWGVAFAVGVLACLAVWPVLDLTAALLAGWAALAVVASGWALLEIWGMDAAETRAHATAEDPGRRITRSMAVAGSIVSLVAVVDVAAQAHRTEGVEAYTLAGIALLSVVASWVLIQTDYLLHYARVYYQDDAGGIDFNQPEDPEYTDFAYFAVGLGMTYQVADTDVTSNAVRRIVIAQTLLGYLFGAGFIATAINLITNLG